jgi:CheY-like chemotaxis protein
MAGPPARILVPPQIKMRPLGILIISPFATDREALEELLRGEGHRVASAASRAQGIAAAAICGPDVIIADAQLAELDGRTLLQELSGHGTPPRVILLCPRASRALDHLGVVCLVKPIDLARLHSLLAPSPPAEARSA